MRGLTSDLGNSLEPGPLLDCKSDGRYPLLRRLSRSEPVQRSLGVQCLLWTLRHQPFSWSDAMKRRRLQVNLGILMLVIALLALPMAYFNWRAREAERQRTAAQRLYDLLVVQERLLLLRAFEMNQRAEPGAARTP
jgi:hypothetical protein